MKLLKLDVEGYRSLKKVSWTPGDLNILIGPNGSGKTNLIRALRLIHRSAAGQLASTVDEEGGLDEMLWDSQAGVLKFGVTTPSPPRRLGDIVLGTEKKIMNYFFEFSRSGLFASIQHAPYWVTAESLDKQNLVPGDSEPQIVRLLDRKIGKVSVLDKDSDEMIEAEENILDMETVLSACRHPFHLNFEVAEYQQSVTSWMIHEEIPVKDYGRGPMSFLLFFQSVRMPSVVGYETNLAPSGRNLINVLQTNYTYDKEFKYLVNAAMKSAFGQDFEELIFLPAGNQRIQLGINWKSLRNPRTTADISDGTLRFLFLLAVLANPEPPSLIAIEEPEIGLHPSMLPIIGELAEEASNKTQIIFTTHSPDFLSAFKDKAPTTTVCEMRDGATDLRVLADDELDYWLSDYSLGEMFRSGQLESM